jgi:phosphatidate cytidylyltransferase
MLSYLIILIWVVASLQRGAYRYQFTRIGYATIAACYVGYVMSTWGALITYGRVWFIFVALIVSVNDVAAYFVGVTFGRTPLIRLSPNKTLEGFLGGAFFTVVVTFLFVSKLFESEAMVCPVSHFTF